MHFECRMPEINHEGGRFGQLKKSENEKVYKMMQQATVVKFHVLSLSLKANLDSLTKFLTS